MDYKLTNVVEPTKDLSLLMDVFSDEKMSEIQILGDELADNWNKKQIFRTETEMRVSVLNDGKHPTHASKYWQSVREMSAQFNALVDMSFDIKRNKIKKLKLERDLQKAITDSDDLTQLELGVDLEENLYQAANLKQVADDRLRELKLWSKIKAELDDNSFDTTSPNTHQADSFKYALGNRVRSLGPNAGPAEVINAVGPLETIKRLGTDDGGVLGFREGAIKYIESQKEQNNQLK